mgnify:CR=1 FL=1
MKRKKKNQIQLLSLLALLLILSGVYLWYSHWQTGKSDSEDDTTQDIALGTLDSEQVNSLHYKAKDADLTFTLDNGVWKSDADPDRPINQTNVKNLLNLVTTVKATKIISEQPEDLSEYGLDEPKGYIQGSQTDGKTMTVRIGDSAINNSGYYAMVNEDQKVYLVSASYSTGTGYSDTDMTELEESPSITAANIRHIIIDNRDKENIELKYDEDNTLDTSAMGLFPWVMEKPYGEAHSVDNSKINDLLSNYTDFSVISCVDYNGKDLNKYGLDNPLASVYIQYFETQTVKLDTPEKDPATGKDITEKQQNIDKEYKIYIGDKDSEGDYYIKREGSNAIYTMYPSTIEKMLTVDTFSLLNTLINVPNIKNVDKVTADIGGARYTMEIKHTASKDTDGSDTTTDTYYYNGKEVTKDEFQPVYQAMISAAYDSPIRKDVSADGVQPVLTITYQLSAGTPGTLTESFLPYNDSFYMVEANSQKIEFFADKRAIDDLIKIIEDFKVPSSSENN